MGETICQTADTVYFPLQYVHDGSETTEEVFSVVAKAGDKESHPARVKVIISLVNDQVRGQSFALDGHE